MESEHVQPPNALEGGGQLIEVAVDGADTDAHRFYERHGYTATEAGQDQPSFYYYRSV